MTQEPNGEKRLFALGIAESDFSALRRILEPHRDRIARAVVFGSRATGRHRQSSDIDIALHGDVDAFLLGRLLTEFAESSISSRIDATAYDLIRNDELRRRIDRVGVDLAFSSCGADLAPIRARVVHGGAERPRLKDGILANPDDGS